MLKELKWSSYNYEGKYKTYEATITQIDFKESINSLKLRYLVVEEDTGNIYLYLECCSDPLFVIGSYNNFADAFIEAGKHHKILIMSMSMAGNA